MYVLIARYRDNVSSPSKVTVIVLVPSASPQRASLQVEALTRPSRSGSEGTGLVRAGGRLAASHHLALLVCILLLFVSLLISISLLGACVFLSYLVVLLFGEMEDEVLEKICERGSEINDYNTIKTTQIKM